MRILKYQLLLLVICIAAANRGCDRKLTELSRPLPVSSQKIDGFFYVLGLSAAGQPTMLAYNIGDNAHAKVLPNENYRERTSGKRVTQGPFLQGFQAAGGPYSFYLPKAKLSSLVKGLKLSEPNISSVSARLLQDNPKTHTQIVSFTFFDDDFTYYCIYRVDRRQAYPLQYGDLTKQDGANAFVNRLVAFLLVFVLGETVLAVFASAQSKRRAPIT